MTVCWNEFADSYLSDYSSGIYSYSSLADAQAACPERDDCGGITLRSNNEYQLRVGSKPETSTNGETSWIICEEEGNRLYYTIIQIILSVSENLNWLRVLISLVD